MSLKEISSPRERASLIVVAAFAEPPPIPLEIGSSFVNKILRI